MVVKYKAGRTQSGKAKESTNQWIVVLLKETCDLTLEVEYVESELKVAFGPDVEFFIPVYSEVVGGKKVSKVFIDRYIFVRRDEDINEKTFNGRTERIEGLLETKGRYVSDKEILRIQEAMSKDVNNNIPKKGQLVIPIEGTFKNLEGRVLSVNKTKMTAMVVFERSSRTVEAPISIINLELIKGE